MPLKLNRTLYTVNADLNTKASVESVQTLETEVSNGIPSGVVHAYSGTTLPTGWLLCDGSIVSRTTYANLFLAIGTIHGQGDGLTTFHLPDYRGRFLRGSDNMGTGAAGRDPDASSRTASNAGGNIGNNVGSVQSDQYIAHAHTASFTHGLEGVGTGLSRAAFLASTGSTKTVTVNNTGGNETRPENASINYIIKV